MSTKTTFKRVALVAVAALGLGVLSVAPSSATPTGLTVTVTNGTATALSSTTASGDTTTAASVVVSALLPGSTDSVAVTFYQKSVPATSTTVAHMTFAETQTSTNASVKKITNSGSAAATKLSAAESLTAGSSFLLTGTSTGYTGGKFLIQLESATATAAAGTYTYTIVATPYTGTTAGTAVSTDVSIVVDEYADLSATPSAITSFVDLSSTARAAGSANATDDAIVSVVSTAGTNGGYIFVGNRNAANASDAAEESVTVTVTGVGVICTTTGFASPTVGTCGKSMKVAATGDVQFALQADGTAGTSTVSVVSSILGTTATKSVAYYTKAAKTLTASVLTPVLKVGSNDSAVAVSAVDANGINWAGTAYIVASAAADALVGGSATTPVACVASADKLTQYCPVTAIAAGTAKFKVIDASTVALATATSNEVSVEVSTATAATVKIAFDKSSYAPGEKAVVTVTPLDSTGKALAAGTGNYLAAALTSNVAFVSGGTTTTSLGAASVTTEAYAGTDKSAGAQSFVIYMPSATGTLTLTGKGGSALPLAGQVVVTASADVVNDSVNAATDAANEATDAANAATDAALAAADAADAATAAAQDASDAVAALSASVSKMISNLRAQITSLTNLVIKIQKKVKA